MALSSNGLEKLTMTNTSVVTALEGLAEFARDAALQLKRATEEIERQTEVLVQQKEDLAQREAEVSRREKAVSDSMPPKLPSGVAAVKEKDIPPATELQLHLATPTPLRATAATAVAAAEKGAAAAASAAALGPLPAQRPLPAAPATPLTPLTPVIDQQLAVQATEPLSPRLCRDSPGPASKLREMFEQNAKTNTEKASTSQRGMRRTWTSTAAAPPAATATSGLAAAPPAMPRELGTPTNGSGSSLAITVGSASAPLASVTRTAPGTPSKPGTDTPTKRRSLAELLKNDEEKRLIY